MQPSAEQDDESRKAMAEALFERCSCSEASLRNGLLSEGFADVENLANLPWQRIQLQAESRL